MAVTSLVTILLLYLFQGVTQGLVFGTIPMLIGRNSASTDVDQALFSIVGYPFTIKFLVAPLVDAYYWSKLGKRESWLIFLQVVNVFVFSIVTTSSVGWLESIPADVKNLSLTFLALTSAAAVQDIATDAFAADVISDAHASTCQAVGLMSGVQLSSTVYFVLSGRGFLDLTSFLRAVTTLHAVLLCYLIFRRAPPSADCDEIRAPGPVKVLMEVSNTVKCSPNMRWWMLCLLAFPLPTAFSGILGIRTQALGFSPEMFAEYDMFMLPINLFVTMLVGRLVSAKKMLTSVVAYFCVLVGVCSLMSLCVFWRCRSTVNPVDDFYLRSAYVLTSQCANLLFTSLFVAKCTFVTRVAARYTDSTATVLTFLNSFSNLGQTVVAGTLMPLVMEFVAGVFGAEVGFDVLAISCLVGGLGLQVALYPKLRHIEDFGDIGWVFEEPKVKKELSDPAVEDTKKAK